MIDHAIGSESLHCTATHAKTFYERLLGLMFSSPSAYPGGMYFANCSCIHTCFMRYKLDVFFMDVNGVICREFRDVGAWKVCAGGREAVSVLETCAGLMPALKVGVAVSVGQA